MVGDHEAPSIVGPVVGVVVIFVGLVVGLLVGDTVVMGPSVGTT